MLPFRSLRQRGALFMLSSLLWVPLSAQDTPAPESPAALKAAIVQHKNEIAAADSANDVGAAIRLRMTLAAISKPKEAHLLYEEVVHLADSTDRIDEELAARKALAGTWAARGQMKQAYEEALTMAEKNAEWSARQVALSGATTEELTRRAAQERDSLRAVGIAAHKEAEQRVVEADERGDFWMWMAVLALSVGVVALVLLAWKNGSALRRHRDELAALRADVQALTLRNQNRARDPAPPPVKEKVAPLEPVVAPIVAPPVAEVDPIVLGMFRKLAPERLVTLREARLRNDHEKVQRVVHSLKPQLLTFDPAFAELCARMTAPGAAQQAMQWNSDLDALEIGIARLLR